MAYTLFYITLIQCCQIFRFSLSSNRDKIGIIWVIHSQSPISWPQLVAHTHLDMAVNGEYHITFFFFLWYIKLLWTWWTTLLKPVMSSGCNIWSLMGVWFYGPSLCFSVQMRSSIEMLSVLNQKMDPRVQKIPLSAHLYNLSKLIIYGVARFYIVMTSSHVGSVSSFEWKSCSCPQILIGP